MCADESLKPLGRLEVICGPMFTGKSTELIRRLEAAREAGKRVVGVKPSLDTRYHPTAIATHDGKLLEGATIGSPTDLLRLEAEVVGLDEAHFFQDGLTSAVRELLNRGTRAILAGLDRTSFNEPFGEVARLLIEADDITKTVGVCSICGREAVHTVRLFASDDDIVVGGVGMFANRCRAHLRTPPVYLGRGSRQVHGESEGTEPTESGRVGERKRR
jgi:thymidine kinase